MTPSERVACLAALDAAERAAEALRAVLAADAAPQPLASPHDLVPLAEACRVWKVSKDTALKRVRRRGGVKHLGRWFVRPEAIGVTYDDRT